MSPEECEALTDVFRGSTRSPEHLAFLARPVVEALIAAHVAAALTEAADALPSLGCTCEVCETYARAAEAIRAGIPTDSVTTSSALAPG